MNRISASLFLIGASILLAPLAASAVTIDTVLVGNPGNGPDPLLLNLAGVSVGSVANEYRIGTYEVTNAQYAEFLNAKLARDVTAPEVADPLQLYDSSMRTSPYGGIRQVITPTAVPHTFHNSYEVKADMGNKPVNFVNQFDAMRFANWLHNGQGSGATETGAYTLLGGTPTPTNVTPITRNADANWFLPTRNEWYKAAFYNPRTAADGGPPGDDHYWLYATQSDSDPTIATAIDLIGPTRGDISNPGPNVANYNHGAEWNGLIGNVTTVGSAGSLSASFYGTYDQSGNVNEWNELVGEGWGGAFYEPGVFGIASIPSFYYPPLGMGFRVATVPEPSTLVLAAFGLIGLAAWGWRRKRSIA